MRSVAPSYDEGVAFDGVIPRVSFEMEFNEPNNLGVVPAKAGTPIAPSISCRKETRLGDRTEPLRRMGPRLRGDDSFRVANPPTKWPPRP